MYAKLLNNITELVEPSSRGLLKSMKCLSKATYQTLLPWATKPEDYPIYTSSWRSLWKNALFTSNWCKGHPKLAAREIKIWRPNLDNRRKRLSVVNSIGLSVALFNKVCLIVLDSPIRKEFHHKVPPATNNRHPRWKPNQLPSTISMQGSHHIYRSLPLVRNRQGFWHRQKLQIW